MVSYNVPSIVVFGSQTTVPSPQKLAQLRTILLAEPCLCDFLTAIGELSVLWENLVSYDTRLKDISGLESLSAIQRWVQDGILFPSRRAPRNVLCTPLTIIIHIVQYFQYLNSNQCGATHPLILENSQLGGIQGLCIGNLSAIAVACSKNENAISENAAVALRLAVCIGAYVDLEGTFGDPLSGMMSCIVYGRPKLNQDSLLEILQGYPGVCTIFDQGISFFPK